jgi:hypothetical protein
MSYFANSCGVALALIALTSCSGSDFTGGAPVKKAQVSKLAPAGAAAGVANTNAAPGSGNSSPQETASGKEKDSQKGPESGSTASAPAPASEPAAASAAASEPATAVPAAAAAAKAPEAYACTETYECVKAVLSCGATSQTMAGQYAGQANYGDCVNVSRDRARYCTAGSLISNNVKIGVECVGPKYEDIHMKILGECTREKTCYR